MHDFTLMNEGTIVILEPTTEPAVAWADEFLPRDAQRWGKGYVIEARYTLDILSGLRGAGLTVEVK